MIAERRLDNGTRYLETGVGWPVVLLHAFPVNADMWRPQLERVPDGRRFIAPDLRGDTIAQMADSVQRLIDALHIEMAVIGGLSMGGYVTFELYRRAPEHFGGMVLADTRATADTPAARDARVRLIALAREKGSAAVADTMMEKLLGATARRQRPGLRGQVRDMAQAQSGEDLAAALTAMMHRIDSSGALERISCGTLVLCGAEDIVTPVAEVEAMQQRIPRSRLVVLPAAGHLSNLECPDDFSKALADFLVSPL